MQRRGKPNGLLRKQRCGKKERRETAVKSHGLDYPGQRYGSVKDGAFWAVGKFEAACLRSF
jgi:hypothetical protein